MGRECCYLALRAHGGLILPMPEAALPVLSLPTRCVPPEQERVSSQLPAGRGTILNE